MNGLTTHRVVEQMTYELAARRSAKLGQRSAYVALAKAILVSDERLERLVPAGLQRAPGWDWDSATAA